jgi:hypothetical protein
MSGGSLDVASTQRCRTVPWFRGLGTSPRFSATSCDWAFRLTTRALSVSLSPVETDASGSGSSPRPRHGRVPVRQADP